MSERISNHVERFARHGEDPISIIDTKHDRIVLLTLTHCFDEQSHLEDQLQNIAVAILNGKAPQTDKPGIDRYHAIEDWAADDDGKNRLCAIVVDTMPPIGQEGQPAFGELFRSPASDIEQDRQAARTVAIMIAEGLNLIAYDWTACTDEMIYRRAKAPTPEWAQ